MKSIQNIKQVLRLINPVLTREKGSLEFPIEFTFYHVLERVQMNLDSIQVLVSDNIIKHNHAIGLLSRNLLSDFIITGYIIRISKSDEERYSMLYSLYDYDLNRVDSFIKMYNQAGLIDERDYEEYNNRYLSENDICKLIRDYPKGNLKKFPQTKEIIDIFLKSDLTDNWSKKIKDSYNIWALLSKYEHIGWNSYLFTREIKESDAIERLDFVLYNTVIMVGSCLEILKEENTMKLAIDILKNNFQPEPQ